MLLSSSRYSTECFLEKRRLFLDSCVLIDWADDPQLDELFEQVESNFCLIFCTLSILEVGFGPRGGLSPNQVTRAGNIYDLAFQNPIDNDSLRNTENFLPSNRVAYNPNHHEWYAARTSLLRLIDKTKRKVKNTRGLANDAVIYSCAWNARAAIISNNLKDFVLLNRLTVPQKTSDGHLRHVPVFTIQDLKESLTKEVSYPENIPSNLSSPNGFDH